MKYHIYNTTNWPLHKIKHYAKPLTFAINRFIEKFKGDVTHEDFATDIITGKHQLWFILDEEKIFKGFLTTEIAKTFDGKIRVTLCQLAGEGASNLAPLIMEIENWAKDIGATEICAIARFGWKKELAKFGYRPSIVKYRKELPHGGQY